MYRYLITYRNKKGEIFSQKTYAKNQSQALNKLKFEYFEILAITKLDRNIGEIL